MTDQPAAEASLCTARSKTGKLQCVLADGHPESVKHKFTKDHRPVAPLATLLSGSLKSEVISGEKVSKRAYRGREAPRDAMQLQVDKDAIANAIANKGITAAKPLEEYKAVVRYTVPLKAVDAAIAYIRRAGSVEGVKGKALTYRKAVHANGNVAIQWAYVDPDPSKIK